METYYNLLSALILFSSIILVVHKRIRSYIKTFRIQSILLALTTGLMGITTWLTEGRIDVLIVCFLIILLKVIYIPRLLHKTYRDIEYRVEKDFFLNIPSLTIISCLIVIFVYFSFSGIAVLADNHSRIQVIHSVSVILIGFFFMISRKKAIGQIIGFLVIENGIYTTAIFATHGMPFMIDIGVFIDMITAVFIMGIMVLRINEQFESINLSKLRNLKG